MKIRFPAYLAFLAGVLPDFDIYFRNIIAHHTYTHSLIVLLPIIAVICYKYRAFGIAFSMGMLSHLLTDSLVGTIPLLYPLDPNFLLGVDLGLPSLADTVLEVGALTLVILYGFLNGDYKLALKPSREGLLLGIPLFAIVTLTLLFAGDRSIQLSTFAFSRKALTLISVGHIILAGILGFIVLRSLIPYFMKRNPKIPLK